MAGWLIRRTLFAFATAWAISMLSFLIIQIPPGDYVTSYIAQLQSQGTIFTDDEAQALRNLYGLDEPVIFQYFRWLGLMAQGDFGVSFEFNRPVLDVIGDRFLLTIVVAVAALLLTWIVALPIGIYSAVKQYSIGDYAFTFIGFIGLAIPGFLLALVLMYFGFVLFDANVGGLFSPEYAQADWSWDKLWDLMQHMPIPALVLGLSGTAFLMRIMRANLLDELRKPYLVTARAKGLTNTPGGAQVPGARGTESVREHRTFRAARRRGRQRDRIDRAELADARADSPEVADRARLLPGGDGDSVIGRHHGSRHADFGHLAGDS